MLCEHFLDLMCREVEDSTVMYLLLLIFTRGGDLGALKLSGTTQVTAPSLTVHRTGSYIAF